MKRVVMSNRTMTTLEVMKLIDSLQAVSMNVDNAYERVGSQRANNFASAVRQAQELLGPITKVVADLQTQFETKCVPKVPARVVDGTIYPPKYENTVVEIGLPEEMWLIADRWGGVYCMTPGQPGFWDSLIQGGET